MHRGKEHLTSLARREESSVLCRHNKEIHDGGRIPQFCMLVMGQLKNDAMLQQVSEAVRINRELRNSTKKRYHVLDIHTSISMSKTWYRFFLL